MSGSYFVWTDAAGQTKRLYFDATMSEGHEFTAEITEHAVEKGANVTDHVRKNLDRLTLEVMVSNTPIEPTDPQNLRGGRTTSLPLYVPEAQPNLFSLGNISNAIIKTVGRAVGLIRPPPSSAVMWHYPGQFDAISEALETLTQLQDEATLIEVITPKKDYENMVLVDIQMVRDKSTGTAQRFQLVLRKLNIVEVQIVSAPVPTENRGKGPVSKGQKEATEPDEGKKKSIAAWALGKLGVLDGGRFKLPE